MANFFKWLFGIAKKERQWAEASRILPEKLVEQQNASSIVLGQEYLNDTEKYMRCYPAAVYNEKYKRWDVFRCKTNKKKGTVKPQRVASCKNALEVVRELRQEEMILQMGGWTALPGDDKAANYRDFAVKNGIAFKPNGSPYLVDLDNVRANSVILRNGGVTKAFGQKALESSPPQSYETWSDINTLVACDFSAADAMKQDPNFENFAQNATRLLKKLETIGGYMSDNSRRMYDRERTLQGLASTKVRFGSFKENAAAAKLAKEVVATSVLKTVLDATAAFYVDVMDKNALMEGNNIDIIQAGGDAAVSVARELVGGLTPKQCAGIKNVVMLGEDPVKAELPLRRFLAAHYPDFDAVYKSIVVRTMKPQKNPPPGKGGGTGSVIKI